MNIHKLDLLVYDKSKSLYLWDASQYNPDLEPTNLIYHITAPGFSTPFEIHYEKSKLLVITADVIGFSSIPDGCWKIVQSVCPNDKLINNHIHFKITDLHTQLISIANDILTCRTTYSSYSTDDINQDISRLEMAKYLAEYLCEETKANIIYNQIKEKYQGYQSCVC